MSNTILQSDLYLNPDPLVRLIGEPNKAIVKIEGQKFDSLIDSGAQISQLTESLVKALDIKIQNLKEILPLEGAAGIKVPYLGYVEAQLEITSVDAFNEDCLFLVMPDHEYGHRVPVTIGTLHIDMIIEQVTKDELDQLGTAWGRGKVNRQIQARRAQLENLTKLDKITGKVRLTENTKLKLNQSLKLRPRVPTL